MIVKWWGCTKQTVLLANLANPGRTTAEPFSLKPAGVAFPHRPGLGKNRIGLAWIGRVSNPDCILYR